MGKLFSRLKKLAEKNGEVIVTNESGDDAFVLMSLDRYEVLDKEMDCCQDECIESDFDFKAPLENVDFPATNFIAEEDKNKNDQEMIDDKELMKRVNEDIAKWREEQEQKESGIKNQELVEKEEEKPSTSISLDEKEENSLTEEEKYYLEPLE